MPLETTYACPACGARLALAEYGRTVYLMCPGCGRLVYTRVGDVRRYFLSRGCIDWRGLLERLYRHYARRVRREN